MNSLKLVYDNGNPKNSIRIYSYCGKKFRFYFPHMNGSSNMPSLSVMDSDGIWHVIETSETLNVKCKNLYYLERDSNPSKHKEQNDTVEAEFIKYIEKVYYSAKEMICP